MLNNKISEALFTVLNYDDPDMALTWLIEESQLTTAEKVRVLRELIILLVGSFKEHKASRIKTFKATTNVFDSFSK